MYAVNLYFDELYLRKTSKALSRFVNRSHTAIRDWIKKITNHREIIIKKQKVAEFRVDETFA